MVFMQKQLRLSLRHYDCFIGYRNWPGKHTEEFYEVALQKIWRWAVQVGLPPAGRMWSYAVISHWPLNGTKARKIRLWVSCGSYWQVVTLKLKCCIYFKEGNEWWNTDRSESRYPHNHAAAVTHMVTQHLLSLSDCLAPVFWHQVQNLVFLASTQIIEAESHATDSC